MTNILNDLLEAELSGVFNALAGSTPYVDRSAGQVRRPIEQMESSSSRRARELVDLIYQLDGIPISPGVQSQEQNLAYLSLKFLLPKLVATKERAVMRWETALRTLAGQSPVATALLEKQLHEHQIQLMQLQKARASWPTQGPA